jgi:peptide chain release factor 2
LNNFKDASRKLWCVFDLANKASQLQKLEAESIAPDFWLDNRKAQAHMQQLTALREEVTTWEGIASQLNDLQGLAQLLEEEPDEEMQAEVVQALSPLEQQIEQLQFALMLSGDHDERSAIFSIHAGSGGVDAQDWAEMLLRMYLRWAEQHRFRTEIYDSSQGEETGIKSVTVAISLISKARLRSLFGQKTLRSIRSARQALADSTSTRLTLLCACATFQQALL